MASSSLASGAGQDLPGDPRGRQADAPAEIPAKGLRDVFWRVVAKHGRDRVGLIAAGVTYYLLLALFPTLAALVSIYGFVADPRAISANLGWLSGVMPPAAFDLILDQLKSLAEQTASSLSIGFLSGLAIAMWSAHNGILALFDAMNVAYEEEEKRGLLKLNLMSFVFTIGAIVATIVLISAVAVMPAIFSLLRLESWIALLALVARWPILLLLVFFGATIMYRFGPSREPAKLRWITWGAGLSTAGWFLASLGFSYYIDHFANYNATYGSLGTLIGFMVWLWISVIIFIVGGELNGELERQTARDSTTGPPRPMGERGAVVADTLGEAAD